MNDKVRIYVVDSNKICDVIKPNATENIEDIIISALFGDAYDACGSNVKHDTYTQSDILLGAIFGGEYDTAKSEGEICELFSSEIDGITGVMNKTRDKGAKYVDKMGVGHCNTADIGNNTYGNHKVVTGSIREILEKAAQLEHRESRDTAQDKFIRDLVRYTVEEADYHNNCNHKCTIKSKTADNTPKRVKVRKVNKGEKSRNVH